MFSQLWEQSVQFVYPLTEGLTCRGEGLQPHPGSFFPNSSLSRPPSWLWPCQLDGNNSLLTDFLQNSPLLNLCLQGIPAGFIFLKCCLLMSHRCPEALTYPHHFSHHTHTPHSAAVTAFTAPSYLPGPESSLTSPLPLGTNQTRIFFLFIELPSLPVPFLPP